MLTLEQNARGVVFSVRAHAGARQNAILGLRAGALRVAVTAPPEKGKANQAIVAMLSKALGISKSQIELISGQTSTKKRTLITGVEFTKIRQAIEIIVAHCDQ